MNKLQELFSPIKAEESLKQSALLYIQQQTNRKKLYVPPRLQYIMAVTSVFCILLFAFTGYQFFTLPVSYISVDMNPSIELSLNRFDQVVDITAYNSDGLTVIKDLKLLGLPYIKALDEITASAESAGYFNKPYTLEISVVSKKDAKLVDEIENSDGYRRYEGVCHTVDTGCMQEARGSGLSFGKYQAYLDLKECLPETTTHDCSTMSMNEIRDIIRHCHQGTPSENSGHGHHRNRHHGRGH